MEGFELKGDSSSLRISFEEVFGYPENTSHLGGYDVSAKIEINVSTYRVIGDFYTSTGEIFHFFKSLMESHNSLKGTALFKTYEGNLELKVTYLESGHTCISGKFQQDIAVENLLVFEIEGDQSYFNETISDLEKIVTKYGDEKGVYK